MFRSGLLAFAVALLAALPLTAAPPEPARVDLFEAGKDGYALYRIPGLVVTGKGTLLAYCEARKTTRGDWGTIDVMLRRSTDGGKTWAARQHIAHHGPKVAKNPVALAQKLATTDEQTVNNPVLFAEPKTGVVHFLYCVEYARCFYSRSDDDGLTFSKPVDVTAAFDAFRPEYDWKVLATGPGHGTRMDNGRLVVAIWLSTGTGGHAHRPSVTSTVFSDDNGATWKRGEIAIPNTPEWVFPNETSQVQLADGRLMLNARSESKAHRRLVTFSPDGATNWTKPVFADELLEPICMGSTVRYSDAKTGGKNRILFANPSNLERGDGKGTPGGTRDRKNLSVKLSYDDGKTWPVNKVLDAGYSAYSDVAVDPDGTIYCLYERGTPDGSKKPTSYTHLTLATFSLDWLTDGKDK